MRIAWIAPRIPPAARSIEDPAAELAGGDAPDARAQRLADRDRRQHRPEDGDGPRDGLERVRAVDQHGGEGEDQEEAADRAGDAADLRQGAGPDPREGARRSG